MPGASVPMIWLLDVPVSTNNDSGQQILEHVVVVAIVVAVPNVVVKKK